MSKSSEGFSGKSPPAAYAKTATEPRLTFLKHRAKLAIVFALLKALFGVLLAAMKPRGGLVAENLALRQQLAVLHREVLEEYCLRHFNTARPHHGIGQRVPTARLLKGPSDPAGVIAIPVLGWGSSPW